MSPQQAYGRLNTLLWRGRLPNATVWFISDATMPTNYGITMWDEDFVLPIIFINSSRKRWLKVLIHECLHISEPTLEHGEIFEKVVNRYWRIARKEIRGVK